MLLFGFVPTRLAVEETTGGDSLSSSDSSQDEEIIISPVKYLSQKSLTNKTIVLDMDLTLLCTIGDGSDLSHKMRTNYRSAYDVMMERGIIIPTTLIQYGGSGKAMHNDVVKRPGVDEFLTFCKTVFQHVILWSAGQASYVYDTVKLVLDPTNAGIFDHIYTAQDIVHESINSGNFPDSVFANNLKSMGFSVFSTKPIEKITLRFPDVTLERTVIVDDLICNFLPNPNNGVLIPPFSPQLGQILINAKGGQLDNMSEDYYLFSLLHFFADEEFLSCKDVRDYNLKFFDKK